MDSDVFKIMAENQKRLDRVVNPPLIKKVQNQMAMVDKITKSAAFKNANIHFNNLPQNIAGSEAVEKATRQYTDFNKALNRMAKLNNLPFERINEVQKQINKMQSIVNNLQFPKWFSELTVDDFANLDDDFFPEKILDKSIALENTRESIDRKIEKAFYDSTEYSVDNSLRLKTLFKKLFETYLLGEALEIIILTLQILFSFAWGFAVDNHDIPIKQHVESQIMESDYANVYKFFINENIEKPIQKIGYFRTEILLREGAKGTAPVVSQEILQRKTVVTLLRRKGNWIEVQLDGDDYCYTGWVEESKVIRFKTVE